MKFLIGLIVGLLVLPAAGYLYLSMGMAPVATSAPPLPMERYLTHKALNARIDREAPSGVTLAATEANFVAGVKVYKENCAVCHGLPGQEKQPIAKGMFPPPPQLFTGHGVTDDPAGETYWKVKNGIRLTGMPGFTGSLSEEQMWQVSIMLAQADKLPAAALAALKP